MPDKSEKVYYKDDNAKITNLRVTCNHVTVPIARIAHYDITFRVNSLLVAFSCFLLTFVLIFFLVNFISPWGYLALILTVITFVWVRVEYSSYVELFVSIGGKKIKLMEASMGQVGRDYLYKIADALSEAMLDWEKEREIHKEDIEKDTKFSPSDTMILKKMILDYDKKDEKEDEKEE